MMKFSNLSKIAGASVVALTASFAVPTYAQVAPYATGVTAPSGIVEMAGTLWVSDHLQGFCRLDKPAGSTAFTITASTCNTSAVSPGQPTYQRIDNTGGFVYVPDNSSKSQGVWRLRFDAVQKKIVTGGRNVNPLYAPRLLGPATTPRPLAGLRATATALSPDGRFLYVGTIKSGNIYRITNPASTNLTTSPQRVQRIGTTSDGGGVAGIGVGKFVEGTTTHYDLYLAEEAAVTALYDAASTTPGCTPASPCLAEPVANISVLGPLALTSDGNNLFVADIVNEVQQYNIQNDAVTNTYVSNGTFRGITGLGTVGTNLYIADDLTDGDGIAQGHVWQNPIVNP